MSCQDDWRGCVSPRSPGLWSLHPTEGLLRLAPVPGSVFRWATCGWLPAEAKQEPRAAFYLLLDLERPFPRR